MVGGRYVLATEWSFLPTDRVFVSGSSSSLLSLYKIPATSPIRMDNKENFIVPNLRQPRIRLERGSKFLRDSRRTNASQLAKKRRVDNVEESVETRSDQREYPPPPPPSSAFPPILPPPFSSAFLRQLLISEREEDDNVESMGNSSSSAQVRDAPSLSCPPPPSPPCPSTTAPLIQPSLPSSRLIFPLPYPPPSPPPSSSSVIDFFTGRSIKAEYEERSGRIEH